VIPAEDGCAGEKERDSGEERQQAARDAYEQEGVSGDGSPGNSLRHTGEDGKQDGVVPGVYGR